LAPGHGPVESLVYALVPFFSGAFEEDERMSEQLPPAKSDGPAFRVTGPAKQMCIIGEHYFGRLSKVLWMQLCYVEHGLQTALNCYNLGLRYLEAGVLRDLRPVISPQCPTCNNRDPKQLERDEIATLLDQPCIRCSKCNAWFGVDLGTLGLIGGDTRHTLEPANAPHAPAKPSPEVTNG
jgi:hypothetical protein